jgi:hypothetical protein
MWSRALSYFTRVACVISTAIVLVFGPIGCGEASGPGAGAEGQLAPEAVQANKSMGDFMKNQAAAKKK